MKPFSAKASKGEPSAKASEGRKLRRARHVIVSPPDVVKKRGPGRKPLFGEAMSDAERKRRSRQKSRENEK
jgi:hypothetical protein